MGAAFSFIVLPHIILWVIPLLFRFPGGFILSETLQAISLRAYELMLTVCVARSLAFPSVFWLR